jgi:hypothetical protein
MVDGIITIIEKYVLYWLLINGVYIYHVLYALLCLPDIAS